MPYIKPERRKILDPIIEKLFNQTDGSDGELNYCVTRLTHLFVILLWMTTKKLSYHIISEGHKVLCNAADEFKRCVLDRYENKKIKDNGVISALDRQEKET